MHSTCIQSCFCIHASAFMIVLNSHFTWLMAMPQNASRHMDLTSWESRINQPSGHSPGASSMMVQCRAMIPGQPGVWHKLSKGWCAVHSGSGRVDQYSSRKSCTARPLTRKLKQGRRRSRLGDADGARARCPQSTPAAALHRDANLLGTAHRRSSLPTSCLCDVCDRVTQARITSSRHLTRLIVYVTEWHTYHEFTTLDTTLLFRKSKP